MTLPTIVTVKATITDASGPVAGRITWHRNVPLLPTSPSDQRYLIPEVIETVVGDDGVVAQPLYSCNDPAASPTGFTWIVYMHFPHVHSSFEIVVPYDAVDQEVLLSQLAPVPATDGELYALANHTHSGGGGGGSVDSVFGRTGAVTAQSGDYTKAQVGLGNVDNTADASKSFAASQITSGTFAIARIPTGQTGSTVPLGNDARFSDARTPTAHATSHQDGGTDELGLDGSQITSGTVPIARIPTGQTGSTVPFGNDARFSDARTPTAHASSHQDGGSDELALDASQVTTGTLAIGRVPTGTSGTTVALGSAPAAAVSTHEAASDPHPQYAVMFRSTGSGYTAQNGAAIYVGPDDPGAVTDGSIWIDTDA